MNVLRRIRTMTQGQFLQWAGAQDQRYEFDGFQPVAMTGGSVNHSRICRNILSALERRLAGGPCEVLPEAGVATIGDAVRYPDALVTCSKAAGAALLVPAPVIVFEVLSPSSGCTDRIEKLREYRAVPSIRSYVILEYASAALTLFERNDAAAGWSATPLTGEDILELPGIGASVLVAELYAGVDLPDAGQAAP